MRIAITGQLEPPLKFKHANDYWELTSRPRRVHPTLTDTEPPEWVIYAYDLSTGDEHRLTLSHDTTLELL